MMKIKKKRDELLIPLTQIMLKVLTTINASPRFYTLEEIAKSLALYYLGLSFYKLKLPHSTAYYYFRKIEKYFKTLPKPRRVAIDETKILHVNGKYYYLV